MVISFHFSSICLRLVILNNFFCLELTLLYRRMSLQPVLLLLLLLLLQVHGVVVVVVVGFPGDVSGESRDAAYREIGVYI